MSEVISMGFIHPQIQIINRNMSEVEGDIEQLSDLHHNTKVTLTDEKEEEITTVTYGVLRASFIRSKCMELTPKGYGMLTDINGSRIVPEAQYFESLKTEQKRRVMQRINEAVEKYMTENDLKVPDALIVSERIYETLEKVATLITGLYTIAVELDKTFEQNKFILRPHAEDAKEA